VEGWKRPTLRSPIRVWVPPLTISFRHHGAGAWAELEAMQRKAELVIEP
jgi:hypothetical protein